MENRILKSLTEKPKYIVELTKEFGMKTDKMSRWIQYLEVQNKVQNKNGLVSIVDDLKTFNHTVPFDPKNTKAGYVVPKEMK